MVVTCTRRCWDGKTMRRYYPGDQDDIDPGSPIAKYFSFPKKEEVEVEAPAVEAPKATLGTKKK